jgi:hypothetical protein
VRGWRRCATRMRRAHSGTSLGAGGCRGPACFKRLCPSHSRSAILLSRTTSRTIWCDSVTCRSAGSLPIVESRRVGSSAFSGHSTRGWWSRIHPLRLKLSIRRTQANPISSWSVRASTAPNAELSGVTGVAGAPPLQPEFEFRCRPDERWRVAYRFRQRRTTSRRPSTVQLTRLGTDAHEAECECSSANVNDQPTRALQVWWDARFKHRRVAVSHTRASQAAES